MQSILKWCVNLVWCKMHIASAEALFSCCWIHCTLRKDLIGQFPICSCTMNVLIVWMFFAWSIWFWAQGMMQAADCFAKGVAFLTSHFTLHTSHYMLHVTHCTLHAAHFTLHVAYKTLHTAQSHHLLLHSAFTGFDFSALQFMSNVTYYSTALHGI